MEIGRLRHEANNASHLSPVEAPDALTDSCSDGLQRRGRRGGSVEVGGDGPVEGGVAEVFLWQRRNHATSSFNCQGKV